MLELTTDTKLVLSGSLLGLAFGAILQRSHFCTMGCLADLFLFGSTRRAKIWMLAIATALLGTQVLVQLDVVDLDSTSFAGPRLAWGPTATGGLLFGFGMVLAGGCASRNLVRLASGSLKALVVLLVMASAAVATNVGILAQLRVALVEPLAIDVGNQTLSALSARALAIDTELARPCLTGALAMGMLLFCLADQRFRSIRGDVLTGIGIGLLVPLAWLATGWWAADEFEVRPPQGLSFVGPTAQLHLALLLASFTGLFGPSLVVGTIIGASLVAARLGQFRLEAFTARDDFVRHLVGGALMGVGGMTAMGCTIGQGLTGVATLGVGSLIALGSIVTGAAWAFRYLQRGHLWR